MIDRRLAAMEAVDLRRTVVGAGRVDATHVRGGDEAGHVTDGARERQHVDVRSRPASSSAFQQRSATPSVLGASPSGTSRVVTVNPALELSVTVLPWALRMPAALTSAAREPTPSDFNRAPTLASARAPRRSRRIGSPTGRRCSSVIVRAFHRAARRPSAAHLARLSSRFHARLAAPSAAHLARLSSRFHRALAARRGSPRTIVEPISPRGSPPERGSPRIPSLQAFEVAVWLRRISSMLSPPISRGTRWPGRSPSSPRHDAGAGTAQTSLRSTTASTLLVANRPI